MFLILIFRKYSPQVQVAHYFPGAPANNKHVEINAPEDDDVTLALIIDHTWVPTLPSPAGPLSPRNPGSPGEPGGPWEKQK